MSKRKKGAIRDLLFDFSLCYGTESENTMPCKGSSEDFADVVMKLNHPALIYRCSCRDQTSVFRCFANSLSFYNDKGCVLDLLQHMLTSVVHCSSVLLMKAPLCLLTGVCCVKKVNVHFVLNSMRRLYQMGELSSGSATLFVAYSCFLHCSRSALCKTFYIYVKIILNLT